MSQRCKKNNDLFLFEILDHLKGRGFAISNNFYDFEDKEYYYIDKQKETFLARQQKKGKIELLKISSYRFIIHKNNFWKKVYYSKNSKIFIMIIRYFPFKTTKLISEFFPWYFIVKNPYLFQWNIQYKLYKEANRICKKRKFLKRSGHYERGGKDTLPFQKISEKTLRNLIYFFGNKIDWFRLTLLCSFRIIERTWGKINFGWDFNAFSWRKIPIDFLKKKKHVIKYSEMIYLTNFYTLGEICENRDIDWDLNCISYYFDLTGNHIKINSIFFANKTFMTKGLKKEINVIFEIISKYCLFEKNNLEKIISYLFVI